MVLLRIHDKLADFEITEVSFAFSAAVFSEEFDIEIVGANVTPCNWRVLFTLNAGVSLEFDKECVEVNEILWTDCEDFNRLGVSKLTSS